jgi:hypothetical protein
LNAIIQVKWRVQFFLKSGVEHAVSGAQVAESPEPFVRSLSGRFYRPCLGVMLRLRERMCRASLTILDRGFIHPSTSVVTLA